VGVSILLINVICLAQVAIYETTLSLISANAFLIGKTHFPVDNYRFRSAFWSYLGLETWCHDLTLASLTLKHSAANDTHTVPRVLA